jgi:cyanophycinase
MKKYTLLAVSMVLTVSSCQSQEDSNIPSTPTQPSAFYSIGISGSKDDVQSTTEQGIVLMGGGTDVDAAMKWMIEKSGGGDFLIIRASGSTGYNSYVFGLGAVNSVETLLLDSKSKASKTEVGNRIREAEALFIAGGDQSNYVNFWSGTPVEDAINYLINDKKVPVGGTSAGCAVLSEFIFDAQQGSVITSEALANPYDPLVSISESFIQAPFLANTIADQHYTQRGREGRHITFLARMQKDFSVALPQGIGVDEQTAVCIDQNGNASVYGVGSAYFLISEETGPEVCLANQPLTWDRDDNAIRVYTFEGSIAGTPAFNLMEWPTTTPTKYWFVENGVLKKN